MALILEPLAALGVAPEAVTHVFLSHHHPDHTVNIALFPNAEVVDFWARYKDDLWLDHDGDGYALSPNTELWLTPGHTEEDATLIVRADDGVYALTHLWWYSDRTPEVDPLGADQEAIVREPGAGPRRCRRRRFRATAPRSGCADGGISASAPDRRRSGRCRRMPGMPVGYIGALIIGGFVWFFCAYMAYATAGQAPPSPAHLGHPRDHLRTVRLVRGVPAADGPCATSTLGHAAARPRSSRGRAHNTRRTATRRQAQADLYEVPKDKHKH